MVKTVEGSSLTVSTMGGVKVDNANVTAVDIVADNGVIHVIDTVGLLTTTILQEQAAAGHIATEIRTTPAKAAVFLCSQRLQQNHRN